MYMIIVKAIHHVLKRHSHTDCIVIVHLADCASVDVLCNGYNFGLTSSVAEPAAKQLLPQSFPAAGKITRSDLIFTACTSAITMMVHVHLHTVDVA